MNRVGAALQATDEDCLYGGVPSRILTNLPKSNTAVQIVRNSLNMRVRTTAASLRRAVGFLLVVFILYGTTVEAAHRHGSILPTATSTTSALTSPQTSNLAVHQSWLQRLSDLSITSELLGQPDFGSRHRPSTGHARQVLCCHSEKRPL